MWKEIMPNLYMIEVPLPQSPLKAVNSYLIKAPERFLLIDTGMNRELCRQELLLALESLDVDLKKTDFFLTHMHADHIGLVGDLITDKSKVYLNQKDVSFVRFEMSGELWQQLRAIYLLNGFPEEEVDKAIGSHPGYRYSVKHDLDFRSLKEGDKIEIGDYRLKVIETPGHTPGHLCLYEANKKILFSGDHILSTITPNIATFLSGDFTSSDGSANTALAMNRWNPLKHYLASLEKVYALDAALVLPGHRGICKNLKKRLAEVISALKDGPKTACEVAPCVTWDIRYSSWRLFPAIQKWFAVGETIAHLYYLEENKVVREDTRGGKALFSLAQ
jgi:glyoxylase-like metal-dependent hydrolase (beta-lactamase superfamily II)